MKKLIIALMLISSPAMAWYTPSIDTTWQIQYQGTLNTSLDVQMYNIDLFDTTINTIKQLQSEGKHVICYFSAGSRENWRPDINTIPPEAIGRNLDGWAGEKYLDIRNQAVVDLMISRIALAKSKGCDAVDPDNVDGYSNRTGFPLTEKDTIDFLTKLATAAHNMDIGIGLKNSPETASTLSTVLDFATVEECYEWEECSEYSPFIEANKAVFAIEYSGRFSRFCKEFKNLEFSGLKKRLSLNAWRRACPT